MKSPFPGMDPYLEAHWGDVHTSLITYARDQLQKQLPDGLKVRVEERISVQSDDDAGDFFPDVRVVERQTGSHESPQTAGGVVVIEPVLVPRMHEAATERSLQIIDSRSGNRVVTTIEVLSPTNKLDAPGRAAYRPKQRQLEAGGVNLVEIDLLRSGANVLTAPLQAVPSSCRGPYRVSVSRASNRDNVEMYPLSLRNPLPTIRIPLRPSDPDIFLDLQALVDSAYQNGGYDDLDYRIDPEPPLSESDAAWADALLREARLR